MTLRIAIALLLTLIGASVRAEDWPQFRGPTGQGHSTERGLPLEWSESRNVVWKTPVPGRGWSSPVVAGGRVWLTTRGQGQRRVAARAGLRRRDRTRSGQRRSLPASRSAELLNAKNSHASPTPIVEGDRVYVHFGADGTAALTTSGDIVWKTRLPYQSQHGNGGSPVLYGDLLIVNCDGSDEAFVVALDKRTGKTRWKTPRRQPWDQAYSTPLVIRVGDRDQIVSVGAYRAAAYDPQTGKEIWRVSYGDGFSNVPRPVYGHGLVYIATGFQQPSLLAVRPDGNGDVTKTHVAWTLRARAPLTPSPLLVGDELYVVNDVGIASCLDAKTGETALAAAARRQLLRVAGLCRRPDLLPERGRRRDGHRAGEGVSQAGDELARRRDAGLDGGVGRIDLHPHRHASLPHRQDALIVLPRAQRHCWRVGPRRRVSFANFIFAILESECWTPGALGAGLRCFFPGASTEPRERCVVSAALARASFEGLFATRARCFTMSAAESRTLANCSLSALRSNHPSVFA